MIYDAVGTVLYWQFVVLLSLSYDVILVVILAGL